MKERAEDPDSLQSSTAASEAMSPHPHSTPPIMPHFDHGPSNGGGGAGNGNAAAVGANANGNAAAAAEWIARQQQPMKAQQVPILR